MELIETFIILFVSQINSFKYRTLTSQLTTIIKIPQRNRFDSSLTTYYLLNDHKMSFANPLMSFQNVFYLKLQSFAKTLA